MGSVEHSRIAPLTQYDLFVSFCVCSLFGAVGVLYVKQCRELVAQLFPKEGPFARQYVLRTSSQNQLNLSSIAEPSPTEAWYNVYIYTISAVSTSSAPEDDDHYNTPVTVLTGSIHLEI